MLYRIDPATGATQVFQLMAPQIAEVRAFAIYSVRQWLHVVTQDNKFVTIDSAQSESAAARHTGRARQFHRLAAGRGDRSDRRASVDRRAVRIQQREPALSHHAARERGGDGGGRDAGRQRTDRRHRRDQLAVGD